MSGGAENSIASSSRLSPESQGLIRRLFRFLTRVCALDKRSECPAEYCVLFFVLALTIWAGMLWGVLIGRGALSAGLVPVIEPTPVEARSANCAHTEWHSEVHDLVKLWGFSRETVRQMVKDDPGVIKIRFGLKKSHTTYRIPESAAKRIHSNFGGLESSFSEQHYKIGDLAKRWKLGRETVRLMVKDEPGVVKVRLGRKQSHTAYSVPDAVAKRCVRHKDLVGL